MNFYRHVDQLSMYKTISVILLWIKFIKLEMEDKLLKIFQASAGTEKKNTSFKDFSHAFMY